MFAGLWPVLYSLCISFLFLCVCFFFLLFALDCYFFNDPTDSSALWSYEQCMALNGRIETVAVVFCQEVCRAAVCSARAARVAVNHSFIFSYFHGR